MNNLAKNTCIRRFMAFVFTVIMVFTTVDYTGFYVYAAEEEQGTDNDTGTDMGGQQDPTVSDGDYTDNEFTEESDNGTQLSGLAISIWDMDENADFETQALAVLNALTKTYDIIDLNYGSLQDAVSKDLWNAAVTATDAGNKNYEQIRVNFSGGDAAPDECWFFRDVNRIDNSDVTQLDMGISLTLSADSNGGATVLLDDDSANLYQYANESNITFCADAPGRQTVVNAIQTAFGSESSELEILDGQGNAMSDGYTNGWYDYADDNSFAGIIINGIREFNTGETYTVQKKIYKGDYNTWTEEGGYEFTNLYIHPGNVGKDSYTADEVSAILDNYDEKTFDEITVVFCTDTMQGTVNKEIINATLPYLKDSTDDRASQTRIIFQSKTTESATEWILSAPQSQTTDQSLSANLDLEGDKATVSAASQSLAAGQINLNFLINKTKDSTSVTTLNTMYGACPVELALDGTQLLAYMDDDDWNLWLSIDDVNQLTAGTTYTISKYIYKGYVTEDDESGDKCLYISYENAEEESLDEEALLAIFDYYSTAGETFEFINITNPETETTVIDKDVVNAAASLLSTRGEQEDRPLEFCFKDAESGLVKAWILINPTANQTQDQTVSSSLTITEDNRVNVSASAPSFSAEKYQIRFLHDSMNDDFTKLKEIFPFEDSTWNDICIADEDINASFVPEEDCTSTIIYVDPDVTWTAGKVYELTVPTYTGRIENLEDGTKQLSINFWDNDGKDFTEEQLCSILDEYSAEDGIGRIYINRPNAADNNNIIYKSVADKACDLFETTGTIVFAFSDRDTDRFTEWSLYNVGPATSQKANQTVNAGLTTDTSDNSVYFNASSQKLVADDVTVLIGVSRQNDNETADTFIMDIFGEEEKELETEGGETSCWYWVDEWNVLFNFNNLSDLNDGENYKITEKVYRGDVNENDVNGKMVRNLFISSFGIDENSFTDETFKTAIQFYKNNNIKFDNVIIEQKLNSEADSIKKGLINEARQIMKNPKEGIIEFVFCACIPEEVDGDGNITAERVLYDMNWVIENPGVATSDIKIQMELSLYRGEGGNFKFPNNTYNADNVSVNVFIDSKLDDYTEGLVGTFGEAPKQYDPAMGENLIVCEEDIFGYPVMGVRTDIGVLYAMDPDSEVVSLIIYNVKDWSTDENVVNRVLKCDYKDIVIPVGQPRELSLEELEIESISSVTADSASPDIIEAEMTDDGNAIEITALKAGELGYIRLSYQNPDKRNKLICVTTSLEQPIDIPEIPEIYIVPGVEEKLSDIDLDNIVFGNAEHDGHFEWVNGNADFKSLTDVDFHTFGATYTDDDGNKANINIKVNMIHVEDIDLYKVEKDGETTAYKALDNISMMKGEELVIGADVRFSNAAIVSYLESGKVLLEWTSKETLNSATDYFGVIDVPRIYKPEKKGKKVFTLSVKSAKTGKILLSKSATVNVNEKELFSFDSSDFEFEDVVNVEDDMKGVYTFYISSQNYENAKKSITVKSGDTNVLKLDKNAKITQEDEFVKVEIGYTFKKFGKTNITITTKDEMKSSISFPCERVDYEPKILETAFGIDKTWNTEYGPAAKLTIAYQKDTRAQGKVSLTGDNADKFEIKDDYLVLKDKELKNGKYKLTVNMPVKVPKDATTKTYTKNIEVKISQSAVRTTIKQSTKVNEFYKLSAESTEGTGILKISSGSLKLVNAYIANDDAVFEISRIDDSNSFIISLKDDVDLDGEALTKEQKQVTIVSEFEKNGLVCEVSKTFSINTENKAPSLVLSNDKNTLYPSVDCTETSFEILNKSTKETYDLSDWGASITLKGSDGTFLFPIEDSIKVGKNNYYVGVLVYDSPVILIELNDEYECVKSTDKFTFSVQLPNWNKPIDVTYSVTVNTTVPKIKLTNKNITLNANEDIYNYQTGRTNIEIEGFNIQLWPYIYDVSVTGYDDKFDFEFEPGNAELTVTLKDKVSKGNYKCTVNAEVGNEIISADLTIKVVDKSLNNAVKVTQKGSIDILRRETTQIYMNPKFTNLSGEIIDFELKGPDADMFISYYDDETGDCVVKLKTNYLEDGSQEYKYSTKYEYKVVPVYVLKDNGVYVVEGSQQKFKLTQSKPKITVSSDSSILYADKGDNMNFAFSAVSKGEEIAIKEVHLLNYTSDLEWDADNQELSVSDNVKDIKKASGKYTLKFEVVYTDKAGNEKTAQTSYKVTIVR